MITTLFWTITQRVIAFLTDVSEKRIAVIFKSQESKKDFEFLNLEDGTDRLFRNFGKELHCTLSSSPEKRSSQPLRSGSLKSRKSEKVRDRLFCYKE
jgi:hypothetical protein